jgi:hypothetical protein
VLERTKTRSILKNGTRYSACAMLVTHMSYIAVYGIIVALCAPTQIPCECLKYICVSS